MVRPRKSKCRFILIHVCCSDCPHLFLLWTDLYMCVLMCGYISSLRIYVWYSEGSQRGNEGWGRKMLFVLNNWGTNRKQYLNDSLMCAIVSQLSHAKCQKPKHGDLAGWKLGLLYPGKSVSSLMTFFVDKLFPRCCIAAAGVRSRLKGFCHGR